jgi:16S rRNA (cytosine1402-N4)-methyltransferase
MRLDPARSQTADAFLRDVDDRTLERVLREFGELPRARAAVRAIRNALAAHDPLTTEALRRALQPLYPGPSRPRRLAQAFQAIRIAVNREMDELAALLDSAGRVMRPGGVLCVIAYHSLEDRMVKTTFRPPRPMDLWVEPELGLWEPLTRKPVRPTESEIQENPRAASARLRAARRKESLP